MNICPNCGKEVSEDAAHCGHCGHRLEVEQKKTMLGLGAVDPEWKKKMEEARGTSSEQSASDGGEAPSDIAMDKTEAMEAVDFPDTAPMEPGFDKSDEAAPSAADAIGEQAAAAATENLGELSGAEPASGLSINEDAFAATAAMESVSGPPAQAADGVAAGSGAESSVESAGISPEAESPGFSDGGLQADVDDGNEWEIGKLDSQVEADLDAEQAPPVATSGDDLFPEAASEISQTPQQDSSMAMMPGRGEGPVEEVAAVDDGGNKKKILIILAVIGFLFFSCCIFGAVGFHFFGGDLL